MKNGDISEGQLQNRNDIPIISVIMPVYNGEKYIVEAITSIIKQTYKNGN